MPHVEARGGYTLKKAKSKQDKPEYLIIIGKCFLFIYYFCFVFAKNTNETAYHVKQTKKTIQHFNLNLDHFDFI